MDLVETAAAYTPLDISLCYFGFSGAAPSRPALSSYTRYY